jgi:hypothetical protein
MEFGIALYDALVGANVPLDKARAVVQALENEMFSQIATKQDLQHLKTELKHDLTVRMGLLMAGAITLLFGMLKAF